MEPRHVDQDAVHRESRHKLEAARFMKDECAYAGKSLNNYLRGHLFRSQKKRIDRHLQACVRCKSEFDALNRMEETRRILKDVDLPEGVAHRVKQGVSALAKLKLIFYRPLLLAEIVIAVAALAYYASLPRQIDLEIESLVKSAPVSTAAVPPALQKPDAGLATAAAATPAPVAPVPVAQPEAAPVVEPLAVSIIPADGTAAVRRINEVMRGHGRLRKMKFSETEREISSTLTAKELLTFFDRIEQVSKVRYNRKRLESFPGGQPIPVVLTLKAPPKTAGTPAPARMPAQNPVVSAPLGTTVPAPASSPAP